MRNHGDAAHEMLKKVVASEPADQTLIYGGFEQGYQHAHDKVGDEAKQAIASAEVGLPREWGRREALKYPQQWGFAVGTLYALLETPLNIQMYARHNPSLERLDNLLFRLSLHENFERQPLRELLRGALGSLTPAEGEVILQLIQQLD